MSMQASLGADTFVRIPRGDKVAFSDTVDLRRFRWQGGKLVRRSKENTLRAHRASNR